MRSDGRRWAGLLGRVVAAQCVGWVCLVFQFYSPESGLLWLSVAVWTTVFYMVAFLLPRLSGACVAVLGLTALGFLAEPIGRWLVWGSHTHTWLSRLPDPIGFLRISWDWEREPTCWERWESDPLADCTAYVGARFSASDQFALPLVAALVLFLHPRAAGGSGSWYALLAALGPCAVAAWARLTDAGFWNGGVHSKVVPWGVVFAIALSGWAALACQRGWPRSRAVLALPASLLGLLPWLSWRDQLFTAEIGTAVGLTVAVTALLAWRASPRTLAVVALPALMLSFAGWWCWPHNGGVYGLLMTPFGTLAALLACEGVAPARAGPPG